MMEKKSMDRRRLLKNMAALGALTILGENDVNAIPSAPDKLKTGFTFLFQGDSITDGNRGRNNDWNHVMGHGYQFIISSKWWYDFPQKDFHFFNRGISGNKVTDLAERWQQDTISLKPDLLSILIGVNDVSALINGNKDFTAETYEQGYRDLLIQTKKYLPDIQLVLCEPFVLPVGKMKDNWDQYSEEIKKRGEIVKQLSKEYKAVFVPFQTAFNKALVKAPAEYWIWDGIHPMPAGHELMALEWMRAVSKKLQLV